MGDDIWGWVDEGSLIARRERRSSDCVGRTSARIQILPPSERTVAEPVLINPFNQNPTRSSVHLLEFPLLAFSDVAVPFR